MRQSPMPRPSKPLAQMSAKRRAKLAGAGVTNPRSTLATTTPPARKPMLRTAAAVKPKRVKDTGPKRSVVDLLKVRSGGVCEWMGCDKSAADKHHRLNRKTGGRHGEMAVRVNGVAWLLHVCRMHHAYVTSAFGVALERARRYGWLLREGQDAARVPVRTRHHPAAVLLNEAGKWTPVGPGVRCAS